MQNDIESWKVDTNCKYHVQVTLLGISACAYIQYLLTWICKGTRLYQQAGCGQLTYPHAPGIKNYQKCDFDWNCVDSY